MATERTTDGEAAEPSSAAPGTTLRESLEDADILLWYTTREGKQISEKAIEDIVRAQSLLGTGERNPEVEAQFWVAFRELATAARPASIDSILATYSYPHGNYGRSGRRFLSDAAVTKKWYTYASIFVLVCITLIQIYWFLGTTWRTDLESNRAELNTIAASMREMIFKVEAGQYRQMLRNEPVVASSTDSHAPGNQTFGVVVTDGAGAEPAGLDIDDESRIKLDYENAALRGQRVAYMLYGNYEMLKVWDFVTNFLPKGDKQRWTDRPPAQGVSEARFALPANGSEFEAPESIRRFLDELYNGAEFLKTQYVASLEVEHALVNSKSMLATLSQYVLPLLYGLLGALAYILRTLSREIQNVTFTRGSEIRYSLRWPLGMLGGVTVGLFFDPGELSGLAVVTPLGLAFLAGYGVELLFTGLDRMVSAFTNDGTERPKTA
jgi:hypothetical protein